MKINHNVSIILLASVIVILSMGCVRRPPLFKDQLIEKFGYIPKFESKTDSSICEILQTSPTGAYVRQDSSGLDFTCLFSFDVSHKFISNNSAGYFTITADTLNAIGAYLPTFDTASLLVYKLQILDKNTLQLLNSTSQGMCDSQTFKYIDIGIPVKRRVYTSFSNIPEKVDSTYVFERLKREQQ